MTQPFHYDAKGSSSIRIKHLLFLKAEISRKIKRPTLVIRCEDPLLCGLVVIKADAGPCSSATVADKWVIGSSFEGKGSPTINKHSGYPQSV